MYNDYNSGYEELLIKANILSLHIRRLQTMAIETFNILNKMSPPVLSDLYGKPFYYLLCKTDILYVISDI